MRLKALAAAACGAASLALATPAFAATTATTVWGGISCRAYMNQTNGHPTQVTAVMGGCNAGGVRVAIWDSANRGKWNGTSNGLPSPSGYFTWTSSPAKITLARGDKLCVSFATGGYSPGWYCQPVTL